MTSKDNSGEDIGLKVVEVYELYRKASLDGFVEANMKI
jgi:hypothetical protein